MNIAILSRYPKLYSTRRLVEEASRRGHKVAVIDTFRCYMSVSSQHPTVYYDNTELENFDAVIPRIGASITAYGTAVLRQLEMLGVFTVNGSVAISRSRDKLRAVQLLSRKGIGLPITGFASSVEDLRDLMRVLGGPPIVIKLLQGTQGVGVILAETRHAAESVIEAFLGMNASIMVQEYIHEAHGADIRCFVVNGKVIAAMKRQASPGEFRSNLHRGGSASLTEITEEERITAQRAAKIMGLDVAGVDILRSSRGPLVVEVNSSPGLQGIEAATNKNVAEMIIRFIEKNARLQQKQRREKI